MQCNFCKQYKDIWAMLNCLTYRDMQLRLNTVKPFGFRKVLDKARCLISPINWQYLVFKRRRVTVYV